MERRLPIDVLGLPLDEARQRLQAAGVASVIDEQTAPPRGAVTGHARVVRQRETPQGVVLTVAVFPAAPRCAPVSSEPC